eukprot:CAMPEP_0114269848 /NCGR_PEP_ID=MMETSP0058-20121206/26883_1 /TAXON_ID=36894 /ORGANISM="Pyramimonas parkeae, CCMP726" /LENGTH=369 /DNA_ID=CAMNT_0001388465 /DNA_START=601 /DNA_END=1707 /DNA_ORIENTATION=+
MATVVQVGSTNAVHPSTGRKLSQEPALSFDLFPAALHPTLREIDDEGNGVLEIDELTEIFEKYADMKRAQKSGAIAVSSFSPDVQKTLKVFDSSGDGLIEPSELQRAAELYADSRLMVSRLIKLSVALLIFMGVMLGCIAGLTITAKAEDGQVLKGGAHAATATVFAPPRWVLKVAPGTFGACPKYLLGVSPAERTTNISCLEPCLIVEEAKETETSGDGVQTVKGHANKPVATGTVMSSGSLFDTLDMDNRELNMVNELTLTNTRDDVTYGYTITGFTFHNSKNILFFHTARGDKIKVTPSSYSVMDVQDEVLFQVNKTAPSSRRKLLQADAGSDSGSGSDSGFAPGSNSDSGSDSGSNSDSGSDSGS